MGQGGQGRAVRSSFSTEQDGGELPSQHTLMGEQEGAVPNSPGSREIPDSGATRGGWATDLRIFGHLSFFAGFSELGQVEDYRAARQHFPVGLLHGASPSVPGQGNQL